MNRPPGPSTPGKAAVLWLVAAALALTAVVVRYARQGEISWYLVAAAVFLAAMGAGALRRSGGAGG